MENTDEMEPNEVKPKKRGLWGFFAACLRCFVIGILAIALGQFLYLVFTVSISFGYMWYAFWAVLGIECFLVFSTTRLRQYLTRKFVQFLKGTGKVSVFLIRWLFILLFAVILLGGLYFKAPWKVLVLDAVLLALLTVVPKQKRKYGWLALAAAVLAVAVWIFIPEKDTGNWRPYTFDAEVAALNAKYDVPDEENAALYYEQIKVTDFYEGWTWEDHFANDAEKRGPDLCDPNDDTLSRPWTAEEFPEMATWLEAEKEKVAPFFEAVKFDKCWFEIKSDPNSIFRISQRCSDIKKTVQIVQRMVFQDLGSNNIEGALEKAMGILKCSYHYQQQASLIDNLVGWAIYAMFMNTTREIIVPYGLNDDFLSIIEQKTQAFKEDWAPLANRFLDYEKVQYKNTLGILFEVNDNGDVRYTRQPNPLADFTLAAAWGLKKDMTEPSEYWQARQNKLHRLLYWLIYNSSLEELSDLGDKVYAVYRERLTKEKIDYQGPQNWRDLLHYNLSTESTMMLYTEIAMPTLVKVQKIYRRIATDKKATLIVIALRRYYNKYGAWPETLELIKEQLPEEIFVDSLNGQQIAYMRPKGCDSFILYSFGEDGIDDGGFRGYAYGESDKEKDDFLFWPQNEDELKQMLGVEEPEEPAEEDTAMEGMMF